MNSATEPVFLYKIIPSEQEPGRAVRILACRTLDARVEIPEEILGCPVTEIASYAFSDCRANTEEGFWTQELTPEHNPPLLCGTRLQEITLHSAIARIGNYAFYNCYELKKIICHSAIEDLGSGLFTGCSKLSRIHITIQKGRKSCLKEILSELRQTLTVNYSGDEGEALLLFPEFYEESVENTPARLLSTQTHGCGHMYRYCFEETHFLFREYDFLFPHMKSQESEALAVRLVLGRLRYPLELSVKAEAVYRKYLEEHWEQAGAQILEQKDIYFLEWLLRAFPATGGQLERFISQAGSFGDTGALSYLMNYRHEHFKTKKRRFEL